MKNRSLQNIHNINFLILVMSLAFLMTTQAQVQYGRFPFTGSMTCGIADSVGAWNSIPTLGVFSAFTRASGVVCVTSTNTFQSRDFPTGIDTTQYVGFNLQLLPSHHFTDDTLCFELRINRANTSGPTSAAVYYSYDGAAMTLVGSSFTNPTTNTNRRFTIPAPGNTISTRLEIRIVGWGASSTTGRLLIDNARLGGPDFPLPVELVKFSAVAQKEKIKLNWQTATEVNNYGFEIERRIDRNAKWETRGFVEGHGTVNTPQSYDFEDDARAIAFARSAEYRLKQIDRDGTIDYSPVILVQFNESVREITLDQNFPNPFNPETQIRFSVATPMRVSLIVYNVIGQEVASIVKNEFLQAGTHTHVFNAEHLASGTYYYTLRTETKTLTNRMKLIK